ncbi:MAG: FHA domain-containing protein, partial [Chloroflexota bacterium]
MEAHKAEETLPTIHTRPSPGQFIPPGVVAGLEEGKALVLAIWEDDTHLALLPVDFWDFTMGREPENTKVDVDLEPYGGHAQGVSRRHARIRRVDNDWSIEDMGSSNGTYINGEKLEPNQPYLIADGDHLRLGQLNLQVY